ncbi:hypothetical protein BRD00_08370 [Halobacteriales archaeon QS_8_69_26]|nr:MAG: hypothetical protein BRD00_08370 [Halobacteriales archaeon QS_8_69_26]
MTTEEPRTDGGTESDDGAGIRATYHGFFSRGSDPEGLMDTHECTVFVTDEELVVGDMGEYRLLGGVVKMLPPEVFKVARKVLADDDASTMSFERATRRSGTRRIPLDEIAQIDLETGIGPLGSTMVEIDRGHAGRELNLFVGTGKSYGDDEQTKEFVDTLEAAAIDAGGSPVVNTEYEL